MPVPRLVADAFFPASMLKDIKRLAAFFEAQGERITRVRIPHEEFRKIVDLADEQNVPSPFLVVVAGFAAEPTYRANVEVVATGSGPARVVDANGRILEVWEAKPSEVQ